MLKVIFSGLLLAQFASAAITTEVFTGTNPNWPCSIEVDKDSVSGEVTALRYTGKIAKIKGPNPIADRVVKIGALPVLLFSLEAYEDTVHSLVKSKDKSYQGTVEFKMSEMNQGDHKYDGASWRAKNGKDHLYFSTMLYKQGYTGDVGFSLDVNDHAYQSCPNLMNEKGENFNPIKLGLVPRSPEYCTGNFNLNSNVTVNDGLCAELPAQ